MHAHVRFYPRYRIRPNSYKCTESYSVADFQFNPSFVCWVYFYSFVVVSRFFKNNFFNHHQSAKHPDQERRSVVPGLISNCLLSYQQKTKGKSLLQVWIHRVYENQCSFCSAVSIRSLLICMHTATGLQIFFNIGGPK